MSDFLTAVQITRHDQISSDTTLETQLAKESETDSNSLVDRDPASPEYVLGVLKSNPSQEQLYDVLHTLDPANRKGESRTFDIRIASPITAQVLQILVSTTIPDHWRSLEIESSRHGDRGGSMKVQKTRAALLRCLCSVTGISAIVTHLRTLITALRSLPDLKKESGRKLVIRDTLAVLSALLKPRYFLIHLYEDTFSLYTTTVKRQIAWKEVCALLAGGRVLSTVAEALSSIKDLDDLDSISWIGEGGLYVSWLGRNLYSMVSKGDRQNEGFWKSTALITGRALSLGYTDQLVKELYLNLLDEQDFPTRWVAFFDCLRLQEQKTILQNIFRDVEKRYFSKDEGIENGASDIIGDLATMFSFIINSKASLELQIQSWLATGQGGSIQSIGLRRSLLLHFSNKQEALKDLFTKSLSNFGDSFYIKHTPAQTQEANTQVLLLAAGYLNRLEPLEMQQIGRSSLYLNAISNRLAASSSKSRFLGMIVGMAISQLVEPAGKDMKFDLEEVETKEAQRYMSLIKVEDKVGSLEGLRNHRRKGDEKRSPKKSKDLSTPSPLPSRRSQATSNHTSKVIAIEEISDDDLDTEDDDLVPYEKPDTDASDSEEDPTLIQRSKPTSPVYIRDLLSYLRDTENVDRYHLGITNASSLIRRKSGFGTELLEKIDELALVIIGLQDNYKLPKFHEHRLQSMIALLVAQPLRMGRWFSFTFFDGDISQAQRSAILTALGLSARELAGYGEEDAKVMGLPSISPETSSFPSKKLPSHLQGMYLTEAQSPIAALTKQLSRTSLQPLALDAADAASGPNALKVRTFSSRMEVERKRKQREAEKKKSTSQDLHRVLSEGYFYPLVGRFGTMMQSTSSSASSNPFLTPNLLRLFLQTLTLILSTLGPHTPALPALSQETLTLIFSLHATPVSSEPIILPALLSLFLAVIDLNVAAGSSGEERLVTEHATQVMELREWTNDVFERTPVASKRKDAGAGPGDMDDMEQTRILAAGILVKLGEVVQRYQGRLMGVNVGFKY